MPSIAETVDPASITRVHALHQAVQIDYVGGSNPIYVGWADPGSPTSEPEWRIAKLTYTGANLVSVTWAQGNILYRHVWDDRATYTYT